MIDTITTNLNYIPELALMLVHYYSVREKELPCRNNVSSWVNIVVNKEATKLYDVYCSEISVTGLEGLNTLLNLHN